MASGVIKGDADTGWVTIQGNTKYRKRRGIVNVSLGGPASFDSNGNLIVNNNVYHLPSDCRPSISIYFFIVPGGSVAEKSYLAIINTTGTIMLYKHNGDTSFPEYAFGIVSYIAQ